MVSPSGTRKRQAKFDECCGRCVPIVDDFCPARSGINRLVIVVRVRRARGGLDVLARTGAGINEIAGAQLFQRGAVKIHPLALIVRRKRPADVRAFAPFKTEPAQILQHRVHKFHLVARGVQIFVAQNQVRRRAPARAPARPRTSARGRDANSPSATARGGRDSEFGVWRLASGAMAGFTAGNKQRSARRTKFLFCASPEIGVDFVRRQI